MPTSIQGAQPAGRTFRRVGLAALAAVGFGPLGMWGEARAAKYLRSLGAIVWTRNWSCRVGEIDIIALFPGLLVFIEVKTRTKGLAAGFSVREALTEEKLAQVVRVAESFRRYNRFALKQLRISQYRFDFIGITATRTWMGNYTASEVSHKVGLISCR